MRLLKEFVLTVTYPLDPSTTLRRLISALGEMELEIAELDEANGRVVAGCLTVAASLLFWRCWSDEVLFEVKEMGREETKLNVYAIPNLFRIRVRKNEKVRDLMSLATHLTERTRQAGGDPAGLRFL
jgi:hypothetical protein